MEYEEESGGCMKVELSKILEVLDERVGWRTGVLKKRLLELLAEEEE